MVFSKLGILLCLFIIGIFRIIVYYIDNIQFFKKGSLLPGPKTIPILGNAYLLFKRNANILKVLSKLIKLYPSPSRFWLGHSLYVNVHDPQQLKIVLLSNNVLEKGTMYEHFRPLLGIGVFTAPVSIWRNHRKLISPMFQSHNLRQYIKVLNKNSVALVNALSTKVNCDEFDISKFLKVYQLHSTLETIFGESNKVQEDVIIKYSDVMFRGVALTEKRCNQFWMPNIISKYTKLSRECENNSATIHNILNTIVQRRRILLKSMDKQMDGGCNTFLDRLIEQCDCAKTITDQELQYEVSTMFFAATDTTLITLTFIILVLATMPEIQERVYEEIHSIFGDADLENYSVTAEDLNKMEYLSRVIKETLRYFSPVPFMVRKVTADLNIGEYTLPKGTEIFISISRLHHNKEFWHEPEKFDPERFLPDEVSKRPNYCYLPFSSGSRNCIGYRFGMMSLKIVVTTILRKFILSCDDTTPLHCVKIHRGIFTKLNKPLNVRIQNRN